MYELYFIEYLKNDFTAVKSSYYRRILNISFNIGFRIPKTDRCDQCEEIKINKQEQLLITGEK